MTNLVPPGPQNLAREDSFRRRLGRAEGLRSLFIEEGGLVVGLGETLRPVRSAIADAEWPSRLSSKTSIATTTYWYALDGASGNGELTPDAVRIKVGD